MSSAATTADPTYKEPVPLTGITLWLCGILLAMANFVAILDVSIANVSVPNIAGALGVSTSQGTWVITSYAVAEAIAVPLTGWLASRFGTVRVFSTALIGFGIASFLCGISPSLEVLVMARIMQGFCGGPLMPLSQTLLLTIFPKKMQPAAMGIWAITTLVAPVAGPMLGGTLCDNFGWGSIFLVNVPVAIGAGFLVWRVLFSQETRTTKARVDTIGLGLLVLWVGALQLMLDLGKENEWFSSPFIITLAVIAALGFVSFLIWELTDSNPIVDLRVFRHRGFSIGMVCMALMIGSFFAINVIGPLWLQNNLGWTASWAGNATGMVGVLAIFAAPIAAQLAVKIDPRRLIFLGVGWLAIITFIRGLSTMDMSFGQIAFLIFLTGVGMPFFFMPLLQITMGAVKPAETANAAGLQNFIRTMSGAIATSFVTTIWENNATSNRSQIVSGLDGAQSIRLLTQHGVPENAATGLLDQMVNGQALMLSTNEVFMGAAVLFAACALIVWTVPRPKGPVDMSNVH